MKLPLQKSKASVVVGGPKVPGEGPVHRSFASPENLIDGLPEGCHTMVELMQTIERKYSQKIMFATREILEEQTEEKQVTKNVNGHEVAETKKWTYYVLSPYQYHTFDDFNSMVNRFASGMAALGMDRKHRFNVYASTSLNWRVAAHSCMRLGMTFCTAYETLGPEGLQVSLAEPEVTGVFTNAPQLPMLERVLENTPTVRFVVYDGTAEPGMVERVQAKLKGRHNARVIHMDDLMSLSKTTTPAERVSRDDVACIMYTSGTTGPPKGVILTHGNLVATVAGCCLLYDKFLDENDSMLAYLPLAHILEFIVECILMYKGICIGYGRIKTLTAASVRGSECDLIAFKPTVLVGVPAVWELIRKGISGKVREVGGMKQKVFNMAVGCKKSRVPGLSSIADRIFAQARAQTGGRLRLALSGGAAISHETHEFLNAVLVQVVQGYGMTESSAMCAVQTPDFLMYDSVGVPMPSVEVKLRDVPEAGYFSTNRPPQGECMIRGPSVTHGYFKRPDLTAEAITKDGWLCTGDVAQWNSDGTLSLIDRKKNLIKLAGGEYIALERLESIYKSCDVVANMCLHATSDAKHPMAIVFPREETLRLDAREFGLSAVAEMPLEQLCAHEGVIKMVHNLLNDKAKQTSLAPMEFLQSIVLVPVELPMTAAQKVQRNEVAKKYASQIKRVYP